MKTTSKQKRKAATPKKAEVTEKPKASEVIDKQDPSAQKVEVYSLQGQAAGIGSRKIAEFTNAEPTEYYTGSQLRLGDTSLRVFEVENSGKSTKVYVK